MGGVVVARGVEGMGGVVVARGVERMGSVLWIWWMENKEAWGKSHNINVTPCNSVGYDKWNHWILLGNV